MTDERETVHGIDIETLEEFAEHAAAHPEEVRLGIGAAATHEGTAAYSLANLARPGRRDDRQDAHRSGWRRLTEDQR